MKFVGALYFGAGFDSLLVHKIKSDFRELFKVLEASFGVFFQG